ncbi:DUF421 domain-containing protein [Desertibacillus haloalkaliphilus]|uniref:DUF421 domain-containing protein n=1 Tax=Desertibacillus haloalkaliphilus TaxID=1328930 RepID=UPI001C276441|nr:DUF421 domain-containing protein [Desertibacillus haloalkaliphilus]MBU8907945.1 DUF421 domain-containing protein [Desertibacillus haloalkaliphilus]
MNTNFFHLTLELLAGFLALLLITKLLGKTQITQITPFDFISALVLGELVGNAIYDKEIGIHYVLYAVAIWGTLISFVEFLTQRYKGTRSILEGSPAIVIRNGRIDRQQLKKNKLDLNQLQHLLRDKDVFSVREVEYAILEANGTINVLKKTENQNLTRKDMNVQVEPVYLPVTMILDGEVLWDNIEEAGFTEEWLYGQLNLSGVVKPEHVFYAEWMEGQPLFIQTYNAARP